MPDNACDPYDWRADRWSPENPSEPFTIGEIEAVRSTLHFNGRASTIPRLVATIDDLLRTLAAVDEADSWEEVSAALKASRARSFT